MRSIVLFFFLICLTVPSYSQATGQAPTNEELQQRIQELQKQLEELKTQVATRPAKEATLETPAEPAEGGGQGEKGPGKQEGAKAQPSLNIYGFAQLDTGYDFNKNDPNWFDVNRPSKLPSVPGQFGLDGRTYFSVRQTRFGVKAVEPTAFGDLKTQFEFDMFGVGKDAGVTTIRPRHYWGELRYVGAGQTNSVFMDVDVFPNVLDYWGPNGMVFLRNPQLRFMPIQGDTHFYFSLEQPGASADAGTIAERIEGLNLTPRFRYPDFASHYRQAFKFGYVQVGGVVRSFNVDQTTPAAVNLSNSATGWGVTVSSNVKLGKNDVLRLQYVRGEGIENYMNDAPIDVAAQPNPGNPLKPVRPKALPMWSVVAYLDHNWTKHWASSLGYSELTVDNTILQAPNAFHRGQYATANLLFTRLEHTMFGGELQWARRENFADNFPQNDYRLQFSAKYSWDFKFGGGTNK